MAEQKPIRLALIGAGLFARDAHLPALRALAPTFEVVAVCSRTRDSAQSLASQLPDSSSGPVTATADLDGLLARSGDVIEAVDVVLPIDTMPDVVASALKAGKHVISEKPVAPDVATGKKLLDLVSSLPQPAPVWMVAENFRYEEAFQQAGEIIRSGELGQPLLCHWLVHVSMNPDNKYYTTLWRRTNRFPGGYLLDGGIHNVAGFRLVLGEVDSVSAAVTQIREDLPPADTMSATLTFHSGLLGTFGITHAGSSPWPSALRVACERGSLSVHRDELEVTVNSQTRRSTFTRSGIQTEFAAFAAAIREGRPHRNTGQQAVQDVAVMEAMLRSAATGCAVSPERIVEYT